MWGPVCVCAGSVRWTAPPSCSIHRPMSRNVWRWAAATTRWPMAQRPTCRPPNVSPSASTAWTASRSLTWLDTSAKSQCLLLSLEYVLFQNEMYSFSLCLCSNDFSQMVAEEYLSNFNFTGLTIDQALRSVLTFHYNDPSVRQQQQDRCSRSPVVPYFTLWNSEVHI